MDQEIRFCALGSARIAYAAVGAGPPLVFPSWWASHVELDWQRADFRAFVERLAERHTVVRYDRLGTGLSDRERPAGEPAEALELRTLRAVLDELSIARADLFGMSFGGCLGVALAVAEPERVGRMVLYGCYADGAAIAPAAARASMAAMVRSHWGLGSRMLAEIFLPEATPAQRRELVAFQRAAASAGTAAALLELVYAVDLRPRLAGVACPVLVLHLRDDRAIPSALGRELAAGIRGARFVPLDGREHVPWMGRSGAVLEPALAFLAEGRPDRAAATAPARSAARPRDDLSPREREILRLVAAGLSDGQIAEALVLSPHTVHRHVANIRAKLRQPTRAAAAAEAARLGVV